MNMENPLSYPREPLEKKPKISLTGSDDEEITNSTTNAVTGEKKHRYKRRKVAFLVAYCGVGYQGMQKNPGAKTIEGDLEEALFLSGAVPEPDRGNPKRFDWARSARTDKGVSAVGQVVSGRFYIDPPGIVERLNSHLPQQIRVFGYKRVTASFSAKKFCDRRRYVYLIPVFALDPNAHRDRGSVLASLGSENELVKCLECSERGRKIVGVMGKRSLKSKSNGHGDVFELDISSNSRNAVSLAKIEEESGTGNGNAIFLSKINTEFDLPPDTENGNSTVLSKISMKSNVFSSTGNGNVGEYSDSQTGKLAILNPKPVSDQEMGNGEEKTNGNETIAKKSEFCYGEMEKERLNRILNYFVGTRNFHNFTSRTKAEDPSARRYIVSFEANTTITIEGIEFVKCEVVGQSFMLHQIRKMIGMTVAVMRNCAPESLIERAFRRDVNINVPTAPEVGLYLDECFFTSYNKKWEDTHEELSLKEFEEAVDEFKTLYIHSHVGSSEHKEGAVALWLHSLNHRNYPDLCYDVDGGAASDVKSVDAEEITA